MESKTLFFCRFIHMHFFLEHLTGLSTSSSSPNLVICLFFLLTQCLLSPNSYLQTSLSHPDIQSLPHRLDSSIHDSSRYQSIPCENCEGTSLLLLQISFPRGTMRIYLQKRLELFSLLSLLWSFSLSQCLLS